MISINHCTRIVETEKDVTIDFDVKKLEDQDKIDLLNELIESCDDDILRERIANGGKLSDVILEDHLWMPDEVDRRGWQTIFYELEDDELLLEMKAIIEKYKLSPRKTKK
jgi:hypothetical protein